MVATQIAVFDLAEQRLNWLDRRATVLAQNVANADTPGWVPKDLPPFQAVLAQAVAPTRTNSLHLAVTSPTDPAARPVTGERSADGNAVQIDVELSKVADTETAQTLVTGLWTKYQAMFRLALGR